MASTTQKISPMAKGSYGVGLGVAASLTAGLKQWSHQFCATNSSSDCSGIVEHKKSVTYSVSQSGTDKINGGHFSLKTDEVSTLGQSSYNIALKANGASNTPGQDGAVVNPANITWSDNLHVKSKTLKKGTPVTISVQLSLTPSVTDVSCTSDQNSSASIDYTGTGADQFSSFMKVSGYCVGSGSFVYVIDDGSGGQGTTDTGTIATSVGATVGIAGNGSFVGWACSFTPTCVRSYVTNIAGSATWTITGVSPKGATYTTDSGRKYQ